MTFSLIGSVVAAITYVLTTVGLPGLFALMVVESFGLPPIPSEVILPFTGFLVAEGTFPLSAALVIALAGALAGAYSAYAVGRWWRHRITGLGVGRLRLDERHLARMDRFFQQHGEASVAVARVIPVVRAYVSYPAGTAKMAPSRFGAYTLLGSVPYVAALVYVGMLLGSHWGVVESYFSLLDVPLIALVVIVVVYIGLQVAGVLAPGWPPRRLRPGTASEGSSGPVSGPPPPTAEGRR